MEKAQPRTDTATLIEYLRRCANEDRNCDNEPNKGFSEIADRLEEQEKKIAFLQDVARKALGLAESFGQLNDKLRAEISLLNKRPKR
jgi:hypothetical protein